MAKRISGYTLEHVVRSYVQELDKPEPDVYAQELFLEWMREFVQ